MSPQFARPSGVTVIHFFLTSSSAAFSSATQESWALGVSSGRALATALRQMVSRSIFGTGAERATIRTNGVISVTPIKALRPRRGRKRAARHLGGPDGPNREGGIKQLAAGAMIARAA